MGAAGCANVEMGCRGDVSCAEEVRVATWWASDAGGDAPFMAPLQASLQQFSTLALQHEASDDKPCHLQRVKRALGQAGFVHPECNAPAEEPPFDAVLLNNGQDVSSRTECVRPEGNLLRALEGDFPPGWFREAYPSDLLATLSCGEHVYGLPIGIHRINHVVYNRQLFERAGYASPAALDLEQLLAAAEAIQDLFDSEGNTEASVFAVSSEGDALSLFFIENVMLAVSGAEAYLGYWAGCPVPEGLFPAALERVKRLSAFFDTRESGGQFQDVLEGKAAMFVTGDWAMTDAEGSEDIVRSMPFPGTQQYWVYSADVFSLPINGNEASGLAWMHAISERGAQAGFSARKYALPARLDIPVPALLDDDWQNAKLIRALPALLQGNGAFGELGWHLKAWAKSRFTEASSLIDYAAAEHRSLLEQRRAGNAELTSTPCLGGTWP